MARTRIKSVGREVVGDKMETLTVRLTLDEVLERGRQLARAESACKEHERHANGVKKTLKAKEEELQDELTRLALIVREEAEQRPVRVEIVKDYSAGTLTEVRTDTGEVVFSRALTDSERQIGFFDSASARDELDA